MITSILLESSIYDEMLLNEYEIIPINSELKVSDFTDAAITSLIDNLDIIDPYGYSIHWQMDNGAIGKIHHESDVL